MHILIIAIIMGVLLILFGALIVGIPTSTSRIGVGVSMIVFSIVGAIIISTYYGVRTAKAVAKVIY
jgi:hypothetical protein